MLILCNERIKSDFRKFNVEMNQGLEYRMMMKIFIEMEALI